MFTNQNAFTILRPINGGKNNSVVIIILFTVLGFFSCKSIEDYSEYNYFNGSIYYNDSLKITGKFSEEIKFTTNNIPKLKAINRFANGSILLLYGKSEIPAAYEVFLYYKKKSYVKKDSTYLVLNDTLNKVVMFSKDKGDQSITLCLRSIENNTSNVLMLNDAKKIIHTFKFDMPANKVLNYFQIFNTYKNENNFLFVLNKLDTAPIEENQNNKWVKLQLVLTLLSSDTHYYRYKKLITDFESGRKRYLKKILYDIDVKTYTEGEKAVINKVKNISKNQTVVMLNENHWYPKHRIFATKLLKPLKENGFKYLAVEAVEKDSLLNKRAFPTKSTGFYSREPFFGIFIREAIKMGYIIVSYDNFNSPDRERAQATKLKKILKDDPEAKMFVYAGIDHILEKNEKKKRMAEYFTELTNINPLTIDQVELVSDSVQKIALYDAQSFSTVDKVNTNVDFFVINNLDTSLNDVYQNNLLTNIVLKDSKLGKYSNQEVLISLYSFEEYKECKSNCIPLVHKITNVDKNRINMYIPRGEFQIEILSKNNDLVISKKITK